MAQRAIININGDLIPFSAELDRIRTPGLGGSSVTWVPDADTICDQLKVTANGTYSAAEAGKYGYDYVVVSVPGSSVTGRDPDTGEEVEVHPDPETGEIVTTVLPTEIRVITPPAKTDYADGETITKDGMVVKAYSAKGQEMQVVPIAEITINPTIAVYDGTETARIGVAELDDYTGLDVSGITTPVIVYSRLLSLGGSYIRANAYIVLTTTTSGVAISASPFTGYFSYGEGKTEREWTADQINTSILGENFRYFRTYFGGASGFMGEACFNAQTGNEAVLAYILLNGFEPSGGSEQTITVQWPRTPDGAVLETTFNINVTGGST